MKNNPPQWYEKYLNNMQIPDNLKRVDGTMKGKGWLGSIPLSNGYATEYSIGVNINGKEMEIPTLVPTLTPDEIELMKGIIEKGGEIPDNIYKKAIEHAIKRISEGKSPFVDNFKEKSYPVLNTSIPSEKPISTYTRPKDIKF